MTLVAGKREAVIRRWLSGESEIATGTARFVVLRAAPGGVEYLQADGSSWAAGAAFFPLAFVAGVGWFAELAVPQSALGHAVHIVATHSLTALPLSESHLVERGEARFLDLGLAP